MRRASVPVIKADCLKGTLPTIYMFICRRNSAFFFPLCIILKDFFHKCVPLRNCVDVHSLKAANVTMYSLRKVLKC